MNNVNEDGLWALELSLIEMGRWSDSKKSRCRDEYIRSGKEKIWN